MSRVKRRRNRKAKTLLEMKLKRKKNQRNQRSSLWMSTRLRSRRIVKKKRSMLDAPEKAKMTRNSANLFRFNVILTTKKVIMTMKSLL